MEGNGRGEEKVKGKEGERWRKGFGPPKKIWCGAPYAQIPPQNCGWLLACLKYRPGM